MFAAINWKLKFKSIRNNINNKIEISLMGDMQYMRAEIYKTLLTKIAKS